MKGPLSEAKLQELQMHSARIRAEAIAMVQRSNSAHLGSALSMVDLLTTLYFFYLRIDPKDPKDPDRDRFILSKGHGGSGLYAVLSERGFFPKEDLQTYGKDGSLFAVHPSSLKIPGIEAKTGSLGHGFPVAVGMALAGKMDGKGYRTVALLSDGECDEGATWEAALAAGCWGLDHLVAIIDYNKIQSFGRVKDVLDLEPLASKWRSFNWGVEEVDGHDHQAIACALSRVPFEPGKPSCLIAHTVKGKGWVRELEDTVASHYTPPTEEHVQLARSRIPPSHA